MTNFDREPFHIIPAVIRNCAEAVDQGRDQIVFWGNGSPMREFLRVEDAPEGFVFATVHYLGVHQAQRTATLLSCGKEFPCGTPWTIEVVITPVNAANALRLQMRLESQL